MENNSGVIKALLLSLSFVLAVGLLAQSTGRQPAGSAEREPSRASQLPRSLDKLQEKLDGMKRELATLREQMRNSTSLLAAGATTDENMQTARRLDALQVTVAGIRSDLDSLRQQTKSIVAPSHGSASVLDSEIPGATHPAVGTIIQSRGANVIAMELISERRQFTQGENAFCVQLRDGQSFEAVDANDVQVDFTKPVGRLQGVRALARLSRTEVGRFCGQVSLMMPGPWTMTTRLGGPSSNSKAVFLVPVK